MSIYSKNIASGQATAITDQVVFTAPSGVVTVVRDIVLLHNDTVTARLLAVKVNSGLAATYIVMEGSQVGLKSLHWDGRQVLDPGDTLHIVTTTPGAVFWRIMGYELV